MIEDAKKTNIKKVAILGAGYIGVELAEAFAVAEDKKCCKEVILVDMEDRIMSRYFDHNFTDLMEGEMRKNKIDLLLGYKVIGVTVDDNNNVRALKAENQKTKKVTEVAVDLIISCVGFAPQTKMLVDAVPQLALSQNKAVRVNKHAQALDDKGNVIQDLYVVGDSAAQYFVPSKTHENVALATNAVKLGVVAASHINYTQDEKFAVFQHVKLDGITGTNAICVFGYSYASTGISQDVAKHMGLEAASIFHEGNDRCEFMGDGEYAKVMIELVYDKKTLRLLGAQIGSPRKFSHTETIYMLSLAIQKEMTLLDLLTVDVYFLPHLNKPLNFMLCALVRALGLAFDDYCYLSRK